MSDGSLIQSIISGVISGGGAAATGFLAVFRDIRKRLKELEEKLGSDEDPKTGLFLVIERMDEVLKKLKRETDGWADDPPEWLIRMVNRVARSSSINLEHHHELETLVEQRFKTNAANIRRLEEILERVEKSLGDFVTRAEFERTGRERSEELAKVREQLATANGLLRGVMTALGYIDPEGRRLPPPRGGPQR